MKVKIKKLHPNAIIPVYAKQGDAGLDLTAISEETTDKYIEYGTGLSIEIPEGYVGYVFPRSSVTKMDLMLKNSVGVIDSGYRGEIKFRFQITPQGEEEEDGWPFYESYMIGDRIGQIIIMPYPKIEFVEAEQLEESERGAGGYGSSGK